MSQDLLYLQVFSPTHQVPGVKFGRDYVKIFHFHSAVMFDCKWSSGLLNKMTVGAGVSKHDGKSRTGGNRVHFIACEWDFAGSNKSRLKVPCFDVWIQTWIVSRSESGCGSGNVMNGSVTWRILRSESWSETKTSLGCESDSWSGCLHDH